MSSIGNNVNTKYDDLFSHGKNARSGDIRDIKARHMGNDPGIQPNADSKAPVNDVKDAFSRQFSQNAAAKDSFHRLMRWNNWGHIWSAPYCKKKFVRNIKK